MHQAFLILLICGFSAAFVTKHLSLGKSDLELDLTIPQIIRRNGYKCQEHKVTTEDGYILTLFRIPRPKTGHAHNGKVVLLQHGIMANSVAWILLGPKKALAYLLADKGYDVWMPNFRGSRYSMNHVNLSNKSSDYWDFSFDEIAAYDIPASIDYILEKTNKSSLFYVGHSMGTTTFFAMASTKPEYSPKVKAMIALAPVGYMSNMKCPGRVLCHFRKQIQFSAKLLTNGALKSSQSLNKFMSELACNSLLGKEICAASLFSLFGFDSSQMDKSLLPLYETHANDGGSIKSHAHYCQEVISGKFQHYDYGRAGNLKKYGTPEAPIYNMSSIDIPIAFFYGDNDYLADVVDVERLYDELPNKLGKFLIDYKGFNHIDFIFGVDEKTLVYDKVMDLLNKL